MRIRLKQAARRPFDTSGVEVRRKSVLPAEVEDRQTLQTVLTNAASIDFSRPAAIALDGPRRETLVVRSRVTK